LAWHKDLTVAVRDHALPSEQFRKPTLKAGVPHVEARCALLRQMLTLRIHLDDVTDENGPLRIVPGSHRSGKQAVALPADPAVLHARAGDVLAMRPLVSHSSGASTPGTQRHRRVLHLEFAGCEELPDGFCWHDFIR
jgi:ectoine hydroxylase-related dioxygenase (phytanoyl-CoA dioxygenase family)